jgi:hypothetical protein
MSHDPSAAGFPTTCWGQILTAGDPASPQARTALEKLCRDYWYPLYAFDRRWALTLLNHVLAGLETEIGGTDRRPLYERLRPGLLGQDEGPSYRTIASELGLTEGAVRMAAHRLRARYCERLREEIARTVADPAEVDDEIKSLLRSLGR